MRKTESLKNHRLYQADEKTEEQIWHGVALSISDLMLKYTLDSSRWAESEMVNAEFQG